MERAAPSVSFEAASSVTQAGWLFTCARSRAGPRARTAIGYHAVISSSDLVVSE
jgi:hypothetical protein